MKHTINLNEPTQDLMKLKYRLMYASSEEQEHSLFEITKGMKGRGWVSTRFCAYPQEIVIQFYQPVNIKQITLIVHETKIPNAIDFFSFCPIDNRNNSNNNSSGGNLFYTQVPHVNKYKKIGFIKLSTNTKSNYRARECRKVFVDTRATFFKLHFHRNYINKFNLFNQVGLFCLEFYGNNINYAQIVNIPSSELNDEQQQYDMVQHDNNESNNNNNNNDDDAFNEDECVTDNDLHQICQDKLKVLKEGIQKALTIEDYGECKLLKEIVDKIRQIGKRIFYLEKEKAKMVEYEDYEGAKYAKDEIDKLKAQLKLTDNNNNKKQRSIITTTSDIGSNIPEEIKNDLIIEQNDKQTINNEHNKYSNININDKSTMLNTNPCDNKRDSNCSILSGNNNSNGDM